MMTDQRLQRSVRRIRTELAAYDKALQCGGEAVLATLYTESNRQSVVEKPRQFIADLCRLARWAISEMDRIEEIEVSRLAANFHEAKAFMHAELGGEG